MFQFRHAAPPEGFERLRLEGAVVWARPEIRAWIEDAVDRHGTLYAAARFQSAGDAMLEGRAPVYVVRCGSDQASPPADRVVRHYARGGAVASLLGDRYLRVGRQRPMLETVASEHLRCHGIDTPRVLAAAVYPSGPIYRGDLITEYVPTRGDLARILFEESPPLGRALRIAALREVGATIRQLGAMGVHHPDVNVKNFLVDTGSDPPRIHLLDLDRCRVGGPLAARSTRRMGLRLVSSLRKWERLHGSDLSAEEWQALEDGLERREQAWISRPER